MRAWNRSRSFKAWAAVLFVLTAAGGQCSSSTESKPSRNHPLTGSEHGKPDPGALLQPIFREVSRERGLVARHYAGTQGNYFFPEIMAGGAAFLDFDNDGDLDVYLVNGSDQSLVAFAIRPTDSQSHRTPSQPVNRLFRQDADGTFTDVTDGSGLDDAGYGMGVAVGDINNDGLPDVYVSNYGPDRLFLNQGAGKFIDITDEAGIDNPNWGTSVAFVDFDRDGWLDIVVANYVDFDPTRPCIDGNGVRDYCNPQIFSGTSDRLFHNRSGELKGPSAESSAGNSPAAQVRFLDVSLTSGIALEKGAGLGVTCLDVNDDLWPDIYIANDGEANSLWINQRDGTFRDEAILLGAAYDLLGRGQASMGIAVGDIDHNQRFDLFLTHLDGENNSLYLTADDGLFREASNSWSLAEASFQFTGFGTALLDLNQNGMLDLVIANGRVKRRDTPEAETSRPGASHDFWEAYSEPNQIFLQQGRAMVPVQSPNDGFLKGASVSRALAVGDIDNDGDLDLLVTNIGGPLQLLVNEYPKPGNWLKVRAIDQRYGGRNAYGATVVLTSGEHRWIRRIQPGSSYLSSHSPQAHFGLGTANQIDEILVHWPDGTSERFEGGDVNQSRTIVYGTGLPWEKQE